MSANADQKPDFNCKAYKPDLNRKKEKKLEVRASVPASSVICAVTFNVIQPYFPDQSCNPKFKRKHDRDTNTWSSSSVLTFSGKFEPREMTAI